MSSVYHEIVQALIPLVNAFEQLSISYYVGGSVSSSFHGTERHTYDVDVIADVKPQHVRSLARALQDTYYLDEAAWMDAVRRGLAYNLLYLDTMVKVDIMPLGRRAFTREEDKRAQAQILETGAPPFRLASAEDVVLAKLEWFQLGGGASTRQWADILGVLEEPKTPALDLAYLRQWADTLGVRELLEKALGEAGLT